MWKDLLKKGAAAVPPTGNPYLDIAKDVAIDIALPDDQDDRTIIQQEPYVHPRLEAVEVKQQPPVASASTLLDSLSNLTNRAFGMSLWVSVILAVMIIKPGGEQADLIQKLTLLFSPSPFALTGKGNRRED
jgi:hypothetical protein